MQTTNIGEENMATNLPKEFSDTKKQVKGKLNSFQLTTLGLAGNPISDFEQIKSLSSLSNLRDLSFNDIHFGKCPVANENGYTEFIMCYLRQIHTLDGVTITNEKQNAASDL